MKKYLLIFLLYLPFGTINATILGFDGATVSNGASYNEGSYTFTSPGRLYVNDYYPSNLDYHSHDYINDYLVLTNAFGLFDLASFELYQDSNENLTITNNLGSSLYFDNNTYIGWSTIVLGSGWSNLTSVSFSGTYDVRLDNVNVITSQVSEANSLALLGFGLAGFGFTRKNRKL